MELLPASLPRGDSDVRPFARGPGSYLASLELVDEVQRARGRRNAHARGRSVGRQ